MRGGHGAMPIQFVIVNWRHGYAKETNHGWEKKVVRNDFINLKNKLKRC
jgi:hypothetical protein